MPFRQLNARKAKYGFEAYIHATNIVTIGKVVELARKLDPEVLVVMNPQGGACTITVYSNEPKVELMVNAYSKAD